MVKSPLVSIFFLLATIYSLAFAAPLQPDGISTFIKDLHQLSGGIHRLASAVNSVGKTITVAEGLAIHKAAAEVQADLDKSNSDVKGVHFISFKEASEVLGINKGYAPVIVQALRRFGEKKSVIDRKFHNEIPAIKQALVALRNSAAKLGNAIIALEPTSLKGEAKHLKNEINAAFDETIAIY
ncbi:hypothetical protein APHAL10511_000294 [Amanita phalloides]|nr:hypothetical protein APHAL10511_000294 [Amanita phalloides]